MQRFSHLFSLLLLFHLISASALVAQDKDTKASSPAPNKKTESAAPQTVYPNVLFQPLLRAKQDPETFADPARAAELFLAREKLIQDLLAERRRILMSDPKARELHAQIMELNKQLAVVLESKRAVREITRDLMLLDTRINALERKEQMKTDAAPTAAETNQAASAVSAETEKK